MNEDPLTISPITVDVIAGIKGSYLFTLCIYFTLVHVSYLIPYTLSNNTPVIIMCVSSCMHFLSLSITIGPPHILFIIMCL